VAYVLTIADLRLDLGDNGVPGAFSDAELALLIQREGDYRRALLRGLWQLLTQAARLNAYTTGQHHEDKQQVFEHLRGLYAMVALELAGGAQQVAMLGMVAGEPLRLAPADISRLACPF